MKIKDLIAALAVLDGEGEIRVSECDPKHIPHSFTRLLKGEQLLVKTAYGYVFLYIDPESPSSCDDGKSVFAGKPPLNS